jgi:hypothetical protein
MPALRLIDSITELLHADAANPAARALGLQAGQRCRNAIDHLNLS